MTKQMNYEELAKEFMHQRKGDPLEPLTSLERIDAHLVAEAFQWLAERKQRQVTDGSAEWQAMIKKAQQKEK